MAQSSKRTQLIVIVLFGVLLASVLIAVSIGGSDEGPRSSTSDSGEEAASLFEGIAQEGNFLGDPGAPNTLIEFADLQCPFCAEFSNEVLASVVDDYVRQGELNMEFQALTFIGEDSLEAARMAEAAGMQNKLWDFVHTFYANQGTENSGYVDEAFLTEIAEAVPGLDAESALADSESDEVTQALEEAQAAADDLGVESTPTFLLRSGDGDAQLLEVASLDPESFGQALEAAISSGE